MGSEVAYRRRNSVQHAQLSADMVYIESEMTERCPPEQAADANLPSDLRRRVYCVLGMPIDAIDLPTVVWKLEQAAADGAAFMFSTPNLNFLVNSLSDPEFRRSLLDSDLCPPDGAPIIWIARLIGLPIKERAAGSDLLDQLKSRTPGTRQLTVFLFGGAKGVAATAAAALNGNRAACAAWER